MVLGGVGGGGGMFVVIDGNIFLLIGEQIEIYYYRNLE